MNLDHVSFGCIHFQEHQMPYQSAHYKSMRFHHSIPFSTILLIKTLRKLKTESLEPKRRWFKDIGWTHSQVLTKY